MAYELPYQLPSKPKGSAPTYSLDEIVEFSADYQIQEMYQKSYRMVLALQQLQKAVAEAVDDPTKQAMLFPANEEVARKVMEQQSHSPELKRDLTRERQRLVRGEPSRWISKLKNAADDPLFMARKHVVDVMKDYFEPMAFERYEKEDRQDDASSVTHFMMLLADNEVNHRAVTQGRAA